MKCSRCGCTVIEPIGYGDTYECQNCFHTWEINPAMVKEIQDIIEKVETALHEKAPVDIHTGLSEE